MKIIFLSFMTGLICAYPSEISLGTSEDNLFPISDPAIFGDDTLVSSIGSSNYESKEPSTSNNFDIEGSIDSPNFLTEDSSTKDLNFDTLDPSLASITTTNYDPLGNPLDDPLDGFLDDSSISTLGSLPASSSCDDASIKTEDFLAGFYPEENSPTMNLFDSPTISEFSPLIAREEDPNNPNPKPQRGPRNRKVYKLSPDADPYTPTSEAYAEDGTPIKPWICPSGKRRACCSWDAYPPFSRCWSREGSNSVCRFAKSRHCCDSVTSPGGPGLGCEQVRWVESTEDRESRTDSSSSSSSSGDTTTSNVVDLLQDVFPILQPWPELIPDSNPDQCKLRSRS